ncbi:hypothetical protein Vadar_016186 [Vaccinium darrowii]|uniref:Uncharacterized protein n=1 Tax=Vaccinium darrowii TaxID=229202 RepID=A0ACB7XJ30_9ERIC|nr:hypothetical protein Vadar_016186 [Vaccinium darrowii]
MANNSCSKLMRTTRRTRRRSRSKEAPVDSLPNELLIEVLARVAAHSLTDLFNAKLSCKAFYEASKDSSVFQQISLEELQIVPWRISREAYFFFNKCMESGNPEALYRQGVVDYFSFMRLEYGIEYLQRAANSGHDGAMYTLGIISLFSGDELIKQQGMKTLSGLKNKARASRKLRNCREELKAILRKIWVRNPFRTNPLVVGKERPICCTMKGDQHKRRRGWESDDDDDIQCDACQCDREVDSLCKMILYVF